jgi:hypothetical protein
MTMRLIVAFDSLSRYYQVDGKPVRAKNLVEMGGFALSAVVVGTSTSNGQKPKAPARTDHGLNFFVLAS